MKHILKKSVFLVGVLLISNSIFGAEHEFIYIESNEQTTLNSGDTFAGIFNFGELNISGGGGINIITDISDFNENSETLRDKKGVYAIYTDPLSKTDLGSGTVIDFSVPASKLPGFSWGRGGWSITGKSDNKADNLTINTTGPNAIELFGGFEGQPGTDEIATLNLTGDTRISIDTSGSAWGILGHGFVSIEDLVMKITGSQVVGIVHGIGTLDIDNVDMELSSSGKARGLNLGGIGESHIRNSTVIKFTKDGSSSDSSDRIGIVLAYGKLALDGTVLIDFNDKNASVGRGLTTKEGGKTIVNSVLTIQGGSKVRDLHYVEAYNEGSSISLLGDVNIGTEADLESSSTALFSETGGKITSVGKIISYGHIESVNGGNIDISAASGSSITGDFITDDSSVNKLTLNDDSIWNMTGNSTVTDLTFTESLTRSSPLVNQSQINFLSQPANNSYLTLTTNNLSGTGYFNMNVDIVGQQGDLIEVTGTTSGQHTLAISNNGASDTNGSEVLTVVKTTDGSGNFSLNRLVEQGGYIYSLRKNGTNWELFSATDSINRDLTPSASGSADFLTAGYLINYADMQTLLQRMGDLQKQGAESGNVWIRTGYSKFKSFSSPLLDGFKMAHKSLQFGIDKKWLAENNQELYSGFFLSFGNAKQYYSSGQGNINTKSVGIYGSYIVNQNSYIDGVLKYNYHSNQFNVEDTLEQKVSAKGNAHSFSTSLEAGKRFYASDIANRSRFYAEPQIQMIYSWQNSSTVKNSNGLVVKLDSYHSLLGRLSTNLGYDFKLKDGSPMNAYITGGVLHEFSGETGFKLNSSKEAYSFKGTEILVGLGVSTEIKDKHTLHLDVEKTYGSQFTQDRINLGYRYTF